MIPVPQRIVGSGADALPGDCFKCCVASLLELPYEAVPHFMAYEWLVRPRSGGEPYKADIHSALNDWLKCTGWPIRSQTRCYFEPWTRGEGESPYTTEQIEADPTVQYKRELEPRNYFFDTHWMASVISENFAASTHAVVMLGKRVVFDPSTLPRRTPYEFVGETWFMAPDPARCRP